jgi:hypothetical protein
VAAVTEPDVWTFGPPEDDTTDYSDGIVMPHRRQVLYRNGHPVGEIEIHAHRRRGPDKITDLSWGITAITYGVLAEHDRPDQW